MKIHFLLFIFIIFIVVDGFPQTIISGTIIDSETGESIDNVYIRNRNRPENSVLSNEKGYFSIEAALSDTLNLYRIGYGSEVITCTNTVLNIKMKPEDYLLDEVVIDYEEADAIYRKALANFITNYLPGSAVYLWHGIQEEDEGRRRESYARYLSTTVRPKNGKMDFDLRLLELNHLENTYKSILVDFPYQTSSIDSKVDFEQDKILKVNSDDDSLILLRYIRNIKGLKVSQVMDIVINKLDTVLLYKKLSFSEPEIKVKKWGISLGTVSDVDQYYNLIIKKNENGYYIDKMEQRLSFYLENRNKKKYHKFANTIIFLNADNSIDSKRLVKLDGKAKQLFKLDPTTSNHFWELSD